MRRSGKEVPHSAGTRALVTWNEPGEVCDLTTGVRCHVRVACLHVSGCSDWVGVCVDGLFMSEPVAALGN